RRALCAQKIRRNVYTDKKRLFDKPECLKSVSEQVRSQLRAILISHYGLNGVCQLRLAARAQSVQYQKTLNQVVSEQALPEILLNEHNVVCVQGWIDKLVQKARTGRALIEGNRTAVAADNCR